MQLERTHLFFVRRPLQAVSVPGRRVTEACSMAFLGMSLWLRERINIYYVLLDDDLVVLRRHYIPVPRWSELSDVAPTCQTRLAQPSCRQPG